MNINFKALNDNLGWQQIAISEMCFVGKIDEQTRDALIANLDVLESFNNQMIDLYKNPEVKTH